MNPFYKQQLTLPSLATQQAPVIYSSGYGPSNFGIKLFGGLSLGTLRNSDLEGVDNPDQYKSSLMGLAGGIGFETGGQVGVEVDIMYVQKGIKLEGNIDAGGGQFIDFDVSLVINQIAIPVLLRLKFMPGTSPYLLLGGAVSYILSSTADYSISDNTGPLDSGSQDLLKDDTGEDPEILSRLDYSIIGGVGLELAMGTMRLYFEGRYIYGMANIIHEAQRDAADWMKLSTILIMGGFGF